MYPYPSGNSGTFAPYGNNSGNLGYPVSEQNFPANSSTPSMFTAQQASGVPTGIYAPSSARPYINP